MRIEFLVAFLLVGLAGCAQLPTNTSQPKLADFTDDDIHVFYKNEIDRRYFREVEKSSRQSALEFLGKRNIIEVDAVRAHALLAGSHLQIGDEVRYFLARVRRCTASGVVSAFVNGSILYVHHGDFGHSECREMFDSALVIASQINLTGAIASSSIAQ